MFTSARPRSGGGASGREIRSLYYDTPADEHIICVDQKPGMQALERRYADVPMKPGAPLKREFEKKT